MAYGFYQQQQPMYGGAMPDMLGQYKMPYQQPHSKVIAGGAAGYGCCQHDAIGCAQMDADQNGGGDS